MALAAAVAASGCGDNAAAVTVPTQCNPLGGDSCLMPWPSSAYLVEADTPTGVRLDLPAEAMPRSIQGVAIDPTPYNRFDGFSPTGPMLAVFPTGVSDRGLPGHDDPAASLDADSPTIVLDMDTGRRVPHFAEVDRNALFPEERALIIRPLERLSPGTRYAVAIRSSVVAEDGSALPIPDGFRALVAGDRVGADQAHPLMARVAPRYDAIFAALGEQGVAPEELVLAWDFVTASDEFLTSDLLTMRERALPALSGTLTFTTEDVPADSTTTHRLMLGTHQVPNFLTNGEEDDSMLLRDGDGAPEPSGMFDAQFAALIPACVNDAGTQLPIPVVVFGHGLFGSSAEYAMDDLLPEIANRFCVAVVAGDFIGLTSRQINAVTLAAIDLDNAPLITEKLAQSVINFIALEHMVRGPFRGDSRFQVGDQEVLDPDRVFYLGASLGGIMGNVFMAYDPVITRGVLGVPGGAWALLFERSLAWTLLRAAASSAYRNEMTSFQVLVALLAMRFEPYDPITTAHRVIDDPLPETPAKNVLLYQAMGDSLVSNLSTELTARAMGIPVLEPSVRAPYGLALEAGPLASGLVVYDEKRTPLPPEGNVPPSQDNGTHGGINRREAVLGQVAEFLFTGDIVSHCLDAQSNPVPCDCTTGVCD